MPRSMLRRYFRHGLFPQLVVFEAVARLGSVTRAAEELHLAQPTVSTQLKKLSECLDVALLEPRGRGMRLLPAGKELLTACAALTDLFVRTEERLSAFRHPGQGLLRLSAAPGGRLLAAQLLASFCERHPGVRVQLRLMDRARLRERLSSGDDEVALLAPGEHDGGLTTVRVATERLHLYGPPGHARASGIAVPMQALAAEPFVLREAGSTLRDLVVDTCRRAGFDPVVRAELESGEAVAQAIAGGLGIGLVPDAEAQPLIRAGSIARLLVQGFPREREWHVARAKGRTLSLPAELFLREAASERPAEPVAQPTAAQPTRVRSSAAAAPPVLSAQSPG